MPAIIAPADAARAMSSMRTIAARFTAARGLSPAMQVAADRKIRRFRKTNPAIRSQHVFVKNMPTSTCIVCHVHPGTNVVNSYLGYTWWDNETDGNLMYPTEQHYPTPEEAREVSAAQPRGQRRPRAMVGCTRTSSANFASPDSTRACCTHTQFADFHGHGWVFAPSTSRIGTATCSTRRQRRFERDGGKAEHAVEYRSPLPTSPACKRRCI